MTKKRTLGTNEKLFWILDQKINTHFAIVAEITGTTPEGAWRAALDAVQNGILNWP